MKKVAASLVWFPAAWFLYDITAFFTGMPRDATPFVALAAVLTVALGLRGTGPTSRTIEVSATARTPGLPNLLS